MTAFLAILTVAAVCGLSAGIGWWTANRRGRIRLAEVRAALTAQLDESERDCNDLSHARVALSTQLAGCRRELDAMTEAHHRGAAEFEHLLERHRAVPEAFRAPLVHLDRDRAPAVLLFDEWPMPRPDEVAQEAVRLAGMVGEDTGVWAKVVYRAPGTCQAAAKPAWDVDTALDGELLDAEPVRVGRALVPVRDYPAKPQRKKRGRH